MSRAAEALQVRAEVLKLARLLDREPDEIAYLERLPVDDLRRLGDGVTSALYDAHDGSLRRLAAASRVLPSGLTAAIAQRAFGPLLSARLAGLLDADRAIDVAGRLPPPFLADVAGELDPRRASELIAGLSPKLIAQVTGELAARGDHVTMGRFTSPLGDDAIAAAVGAMDDATVLRVAFVLEDKQQLGRLLAALPESRVDEIVAAAAAEGLWVEALDLLAHLPATQRQQLVDAAAELDDAAVAGIVEAVAEHDLWPEALLIAERDEALQARLAERARSLPVRRRRALAQQARVDGALTRLGVLGDALAAH